MAYNLYLVMDSNYDWCCFAFETTRNKAKLIAANEFDCDYKDMRCKTLEKGVDISRAMLVTCEEDDGYNLVKELGYEYREGDSE